MLECFGLSGLPMLSLSAFAAALAVWLIQRPSPAQRLKSRSDLVNLAWKRFLVWLRQVPTTAKQRREAAVKQELPLVCELLAVCLEVGLPLRTAVEILVSTSDQPANATLAQVIARIQLGVEESTAWQELNDEPGWEELAKELYRRLKSGGYAI